jgi:hypothetical protein
MSLLKTNAVQIGQSATATNNFTLAVPSSPDQTIKLARGNSGATTADILSIDASGNAAFAGGLSAASYTGELPAGSVRNVLFTSTATQTAVSTTEVAIGLSQAVTVTTAGQRILAMVNVLVQTEAAYQNSRTASIMLKRGSTIVGGSPANTSTAVAISAQASSTVWVNYCSFNFVDTPGIGTHTYSVSMKAGSGTFYAQAGSVPSYLTLMHING